MRALIISGGIKPSNEIILKYVEKSDVIIGVDKGCNYLIDIDKTPNYIVGDFDSVDKKNLKILEEAKVTKYQYEAEKDYTDSELAFILAFELGVTEISFIGATGSRFDHTIGSLGLLKKSMERGIKATIIDDNNKITIINKKTELEKDNNYKYISFLAYDNTVEDFSIRGAKYVIKNYRLEVGDNRTISNEFLNTIISVEFNEGNILIVYSRD